MGTLLFLLFLTAAGVAAYLASQRQKLLLLRARDEQIIAERVREISHLQSVIQQMQHQLGESAQRLSETQRASAALKERLDHLARYEQLGTLEALDAELVRLKEAEKEYRSKINEHIASANLRARKIVDEANRRAQQIAGDAVAVARDFRQYEQAVKAMKNVVAGYGNQYIIPAQSLLDELAEVYGHTEAGRELKRARERVRQMVVNGTAAECDYVEASRKETAITFVVDAFNGKVDTILSRSKRDNYGILRQAIIDACTLVNLNGRAFREARITEEYLNARIDELKWACAAHEIRMQAQEEQRRLREQMREEEKARREYERAMKEAAKEEALLKKAMEAAQRQLAAASEAQKAEFEAKLADLQDKLKAAEEKNQRALSMAQQTKFGHVYVISNVGSFGENVYKIGMTRRLEPMDRVRELSDASVPFDFDVHAFIESDDAPALENALQRQFVLDRVNKVNHRREFFRTRIEDIKRMVEDMGLQARWTMSAEARQYFETLAIEKDIAANPESRDAWINRQYSMDALDYERIMSGNDPEEEVEAEVAVR